MLGAAVGYFSPNRQWRSQMDDYDRPGAPHEGGYLRLAISAKVTMKAWQRAQPCSVKLPLNNGVNIYRPDQAIKVVSS